MVLPDGIRPGVGRASGGAYDRRQFAVTTSPPDGAGDGVALGDALADGLGDGVDDAEGVVRGVGS
jgi:hypothetical protein